MPQRSRLEEAGVVACFHKVQSVLASQAAGSFLTKNGSGLFGFNF